MLGTVSLVAAVGITALLVGPCSTDGDGGTVVASETTADAPADGVVARSDAFPGDGRPVVLVDARLERADARDRFVLEFDGPVPEHLVTQGALPAPSPTGEDVDLTGTGYLRIVVSPVDARRAGYTGPDRLPAGDARLVTGAVYTQDLDGFVGWTLGVDGAVSVHISEAHDPSRLIIDVASAPSPAG